MSKKHLPQRDSQSEVTLSHSKFPHFVSSARILGVASAPGLANQQIRQPKERVQPRCVLRQSTVGHLLHAEEVLDDPERMFNLGPDAGLACSMRSCSRPIGVSGKALRLPARMPKHCGFRGGEKEWGLWSAYR